jgi:hypothetical protein
VRYSQDCHSGQAGAPGDFWEDHCLLVDIYTGEMLFLKGREASAGRRG